MTHHRRLAPRQRLYAVCARGRATQSCAGATGCPGGSLILRLMSWKGSKMPMKSVGWPGTTVQNLNTVAVDGAGSSSSCSSSSYTVRTTTTTTGNKARTGRETPKTGEGLIYPRRLCDNQRGLVDKYLAMVPPDVRQAAQQRPRQPVRHKHTDKRVSGRWGWTI